MTDAIKVMGCYQKLKSWKMKCSYRPLISMKEGQVHEKSILPFLWSYINSTQLENQYHLIEQRHEISEWLEEWQWIEVSISILKEKWDMLLFV